MTAEIPLDEVVYFDECTSDPLASGGVSDADSTPTFSVFEEATDTPILSAQNFTKRTSLTGNYRGTFTCSAANGFEVGKWYNVISTAVVSSITGKKKSMTFRIVAAENQAGYPLVDVSYAAGVAVQGSDLTIASATSTTITLPSAYSDSSSLPDDDRHEYTIFRVVAGTGAGQCVLTTTAGASARQYNVLSGTMPVQLDATSQCDIVGVWQSTATAITAATANKIADHCRRRTQANVEASANGDTLSLGSEYGMIQQAQESNLVDTPGEQTVYQTDGTTVLGTKNVTSDSAAEPITGIS